MDPGCVPFSLSSLVKGEGALPCSFSCFLCSRNVCSICNWPDTLLFLNVCDFWIVPKIMQHHFESSIEYFKNSARFNLACNWHCCSPLPGPHALHSWPDHFTYLNTTGPCVWSFCFAASSPTSLLPDPVHCQFQTFLAVERQNDARKVDDQLTRYGNSQ